uniref:Uncharacterized protein n=1 Tax=Cacopsylla melanoneura TaxID=428564 RepID=A0A8D8ZDX5_9HEMI
MFANRILSTRHQTSEELIPISQEDKTHHGVYRPVSDKVRFHKHQASFAMVRQYSLSLQHTMPSSSNMVITVYSTMALYTLYLVQKIGWLVVWLERVMLA